MERDTVNELIIERRSIRKYLDKKVSDQDIHTILRAAMYAPSAVNRQPWHFIVIDDKKIFDQIIAFHPHATFLRNASHAILVCGDELMQHDDGYYILDCSAATQNMLLAAHNLGLGACWIGIHPREERRKQAIKLFKLPAHVQPFALISLGHPAEKRTVSERFDAAKIHNNYWGQQEML